MTYKENTLTCAFFLMVLNASAQNDFATVCYRTNEIHSSVLYPSAHVFQSKYGELDNAIQGSLASDYYQKAIRVKTHKKGGLLKGALIGAGIGVLPFVVGAALGKSTAEGGAYVTFITLPVDIITGAIIGATSKRKHSRL